MKKWCLALLLLSVGCVSKPIYRARVEYSYGEPVLVGEWVNHHGSGQPINVHDVSIKAVVPVVECKDIRFDLPVGPYVAYPQHYESSNVFGFEVAPRAVYIGWEQVHPYLECVGGVSLMKGHWRDEGSSFNFNTGGGIGALVPVSSKIDVSIGYRYWHLSNAGTSYPNAGYNSDSILFGAEYKF